MALIRFHGYISDTILFVSQLLVMATVLRTGHAFILTSDYSDGGKGGFGLIYLSYQRG